MHHRLEESVTVAGLAMFRAAVPPSVETWRALRSVCVEVEPAPPMPGAPQQHGEWALFARHPEWGQALVRFDRAVGPPQSHALAVSVGSTVTERKTALAARSCISVGVQGSRRDVVHDRKRLLRWLRLVVGADGVGAWDDGSARLWSPAALDDELAVDAALDVSALFSVHAVTRDGSPHPCWVHTHGLAGLGGFDFDVLRPSRDLVEFGTDTVRSLASAVVEGLVAPDAPCYSFAKPGGDVSMVPVAEFMRDGPLCDRSLRETGPADPHDTDRSVVCEPRDEDPDEPPRPSEFLSTLVWDGVVFRVVPETERQSADRARRTLPAFRSLLEEFAPIGASATVRLAFDQDGRGPESAEHLWFDVHAVRGDDADTTLLNDPVCVTSLRSGDRAWRTLERLTDWTIQTPLGELKPRCASTARQIRESVASAQRLWKAGCRRELRALRRAPGASGAVRR